LTFVSLPFPACRGVQRLGRLAGQVEELEDHADPLPRDGDWKIMPIRCRATVTVPLAGRSIPAGQVSSVISCPDSLRS
jgi:hypothetical protein